MEELIESMKIIEKYNDMPFEDFIKEYEILIGVEIPKEDRDNWKFMGLRNTDYIVFNFIS